MKNVQGKIDKHKMENLKNISKGNFDEVVDPISKMKIGKTASYILKLENVCTKRNLVIFMIVLLLFVFKIYPAMKYVIITMDHHYFGIFTDQIAPLAMTTPHKNYYQELGIEYRTLDD